MASPVAQPVPERPSRFHRLGPWARRRAHSIRAWLGYAWFMTFGTFLPLPMFLLGYLIHLTLVGAPLAQDMYRLAVYTTTLGQEPPGKDKPAGKEKTQEKPFAERIRPYSPPGRLEKRERPVAVWLRVVWFVFVGWWLGAIWVVLSWAILLAPYPFLDMIKELLSELPSVMTLATPAPGRTPTPRSGQT